MVYMNLPGKTFRRWIGGRVRPRTAPGAAPGTIQVDPKAPKPVIRIMAYGSADLEEVEVSSVDQIRAMLGKQAVTWVNVDGLGDVDTLRALGEIFDLHKLALEGVANTNQRPKVEAWPDQFFIVTRMIHLHEDHLTTEQCSVFLGKGFVLTFQERQGDCLDPVRERIRGASGRIRKRGADYLAYATLDAIVDSYFPVLEQYGEHLEALEDEVIENPIPATIAAVHQVKRDLLTFRRAVWPLREAINTLQRDESDLVSDTTQVFLRDCYDHTIQVIDMVETYREIGSGLLDAYMSSVSNKMNEVMKVLTIIATIFIPLTFVAGIYGMNFENMPELSWKYGYLYVWGVMAVLVTGLVWFFGRKGWLGSSNVKNHNRGNG